MTLFEELLHIAPLSTHDDVSDYAAVGPVAFPSPKARR